MVRGPIMAQLGVTQAQASLLVKKEKIERKNGNKYEIF